MGLKITSLESALVESREKAAAAPTGQGCNHHHLDKGCDDDIYIMMKCMSVCHVFAYFAFPLPSWRYIYNDEVSVCLSRFCLFCLPPAKLTIYIYISPAWQGEGKISK